MVFRFTNENDKELMREAIAQKPFAAKYGDSARVWATVAERVSAAIQIVVLEKQVRDRVRLLKKIWRAGELRSALGSGIEETLEAVSEQSHYDTLAGLVGQYLLPEEAFIDDKKKRTSNKKADEASVNRCAIELVDEAVLRRALRLNESVLDDGSSDSEASVTSSSTSSTPAKNQRVATASKRTPTKTQRKRKSVFHMEAERQDKRMRDDMELRRQHFDQKMQSQLQLHQDGIGLEREMHESSMQMEIARTEAQETGEANRLRAQQESEECNRQLILECVRVFSEAFQKTRSE
ncbi:hypothetical protein L914_01391 [Phytophthora nicotianae]|uniref:Uncharacterized protein n=2 Tax=Phytophthora nicotianae TaxID=4792 RepID=V9FYP7_PHYNI|nr:hypothetical protein F443_01474 [Phytophthora nicotianae P1569]ETM55377.1 hypothetical protein L914_01391 [Phytophthora nicotianae]